MSRIDTRMVVITLGAMGALLARRDGPVTRVPAREVTGAHAIGAGDAFVSALTLALAARAEPEMATEIAVEAATLAVSKERTPSVSQLELLQSFGERLASGIEAKLLEVARARRYKPSGDV